MELVPGEDLAAVLARGPLAVDRALAIARQIAEALEAAHEQGVIHRDLKPANIKVTPDGRVKVLDFGLAKTLDADPGSVAGSPSMSPTLTSAGTVAGMILGTAAYMSPEAGARPGGRQTRRHLGLRLSAVRDADRVEGLCGRDGLGHPGGGPYRPARPQVHRTELRDRSAA